MTQKNITLNQLFQLLKQHYHNEIEEWWPHENLHEIVVGAFLVQNTTWHNVELSLEKIRTEYAFAPQVFRTLAQEELIRLIYSSGFHQNKAQNIRAFFDWTALFNDDYQAILAHYGPQLRHELLKKRGIGPETADVLLMYVFNQPVFIADTYARRLFQQLQAPVPNTYAAVKQFAEKNGQLTIAEWASFHGWIIRFAQNHLKPRQKWQDNMLVPYQLIDNP